MNKQPIETTLKLRVGSVEQFLDFGGSPMLEPRIHPQAAKAIWCEALQQASCNRFLIEVTAPPEDLGRGAEVSEAIHHHFFWQTQEANEELHEIFREGRLGLLLGLIVVALLLAGSEAVLLLGRGRLLTTLSESMIIAAWVAIWRPAELLLYSHLPVRRRRNLARALAQAGVVLRSSDSFGPNNGTS